MRFLTSRFGTIDVKLDEIVYFDEGLFEFEDYHRFVILNISENNNPFRWFQSLEEPNLAFVIIEPSTFMSEYDIQISDEDQKLLELTRSEDAIIYAIVSFPENPEDISVNLKGPLIINAINRKGRQIISNNPNHSVKTKILDEMHKSRAKA